MTNSTNLTVRCPRQFHRAAMRYFRKRSDTDLSKFVRTAIAREMRDNPIEPSSKKSK